MKAKLLAIAAALAATSHAAAAADLAVSQKDKTFAPGTLAAKVGDTVIFSNDDSVAHNVMSASGAQRFNLGSSKPGTTASVTLEHSGKVEVRCAIHPKMKLEIDVAE
jgi:plastocyanin